MVISWCLKCGTLRFEICIYRRSCASARLACLAARLSLAVMWFSGGCFTIRRNCGSLVSFFTSSGRSVSIATTRNFIASRLMILRRLPKFDPTLTATPWGRGAWFWRSAWLLLDASCSGGHSVRGLSSRLCSSSVFLMHSSACSGMFPNGFPPSAMQAIRDPGSCKGIAVW